MVLVMEILLGFLSGILLISSPFSIFCEVKSLKMIRRFLKAKHLKVFANLCPVSDRDLI